MMMEVILEAIPQATLQLHIIAEQNRFDILTLVVIGTTTLFCFSWAHKRFHWYLANSI